LNCWLEGKSYPSYRADQILQWIYQYNVTDWAQMSNIPADLRERLAGEFVLRSSNLVRTSGSGDGTVKLLLRWPDGVLVETVLMSEGIRRTVCLSSQAGCPVRCAFCASGQNGLQRSLKAGEIVEQLLRAREQLSDTRKISNVVVMGMGEPLLNYDETLQAVKIINASWAMNIAARHITISTIGLPDQIRRLAHEPLQITLAVSLHAGDDQLRAKLIPWADKYPLRQLFEAIDYYFQTTHREVTLEYILLDGVNCLPTDAAKLARWAKCSRCNVNLINYNPVSGSDFRPAGAAVVRAFMGQLRGRGVNVHLRKSRGRQIDAACGQLRNKAL